MVLRAKSSCQEQGTLRTYCKVVNYRLETYAPDDVIAKIDAEIIRFPQLPNKTPIEYANLL